MFQSIYEHLIVKHTLIVSFFLLFHLTHKEFFLYKRIVKFSVGIAELVIFDEQLESFSQSRFGSVVLSQRRHWLRMFDDEGGIKALSL